MWRGSPSYRAWRAAPAASPGAAPSGRVGLFLASPWLVDPPAALRDLPWLALAAGANGGLSAFLSAGIFVTLGALFGVTTRVQLLEMSQLPQPPLLRLQGA